MKIPFFMFKTIRDFFRQLAFPQFYVIAGIASILSLVTILTGKPWAIYVALSGIIISLVIVVLAITFTLLRFIEKNQKVAFIRKSSFFKYSTTNGTDYVFEVYRLIQAKKPILTDIVFKLVSSGTIVDFKSNLQESIDISSPKEKGKWGRVKLKLKAPMVFNESGVIHYKVDATNCYEGKEKAYLQTRIVEPTDLIHYRIILAHKTDAFEGEAVVLRKKNKNQVDVEPEPYGKKIPFDKKTKSYEYHQIKPEIGYTYTIQWDK